jgi:hypothetical protein
MIPEEMLPSRATCAGLLDSCRKLFVGKDEHLRERLLSGLAFALRSNDRKLVVIGMRQMLWMTCVYGKDVSFEQHTRKGCGHVATTIFEQ